MARYLVDFTYINALFRDIPAEDDLWDAYLQHVRNRFRAELDSSPFVVSDLFRWDGAGNWDTTGTAFLIKKGDQEWIFGFCRSSGTASSSRAQLENTLAEGSTSVITSYFNNEAGSTTTSMTTAPLFVHYNCRKGSYDVGFDDQQALTFAGGDFGEPASSPWSEFEQFMPDDALWGVALDMNLWSSSPTTSMNRHFVVLDDTLEFIALYSSETDPNIRYINMLGSLYVNYDDLDQNREGVFYNDLSYNTSSGIFSNAIRTVFYNPKDDTVRDRASGDNIHAHYNSRFSSVPRADNTWPWASVQVHSDNTFKGWFHRDVLRAMGASNTALDYFRAWPTPHGPIMKLHRRFAYAWVDGKTHPPYPDTDPIKGFDYR